MSGNTSATTAIYDKNPLLYEYQNILLPSMKEKGKKNSARAGSFLKNVPIADIIAQSSSNNQTTSEENVKFAVLYNPNNGSFSKINLDLPKAQPNKLKVRNYFPFLKKKPAEAKQDDISKEK